MFSGTASVVFSSVASTVDSGVVCSSVSSVVDSGTAGVVCSSTVDSGLPLESLSVLPSPPAFSALLLSLELPGASWSPLPKPLFLPTLELLVCSSQFDRARS